MKKLLLMLTLVVLTNAITVEQLFNVKTTKVVAKKIELNRTYNGYVKIIDENIYTISLTYDGFVKNLQIANIYDHVTKGQKLFDIYSPELYKAQIELLSAQKVSRSLAKSIERKLELYDVPLATIKRIKRAKRALKYLPFYAPFSGTVIAKNLTEGASVKKAEALYRLADLSKVWVVAKAYEEDRAYIQIGSKVKVTLSGLKGVYEGVVDFINPIIDRANKTMEFRVTLENSSGKIQPDSYATISTLLPSKKRLVLPTTAVVTKGERHFVFVPSEYEGEYKSREIEAKRLSSSTFEVISGLKEQDEVVNNALFLIDSDIEINGQE